MSIILKENGGIVFVGEATNNFSKKFLVSKARFSNEIPVPYLYKDLILININPTGSILWHKKIAKNQVTYLDAGYNSSYFMGIVKNNLYLVFNDNKKNVNIPNATKAKEMDKAENSIPVVVTVDLDHESKVITRKQLVNSEDSKFILCPRINLRVSNQELIILKEKDSSYSFGHINF